MESVSSSIMSSCPHVFDSVVGALCLNVLTSLIANLCHMVDDTQWPEDRTDEILKMKGTVTYDFIIVGAGTAGSIVASRLSNRFPSSSVLLVEAGGNPGLESEIPGLLFLNQNTDMDWNYRTHPDGKSCLGFVNQSCVWSKGKTMGGSSSINAMLYLRGHAEDYDEWEKIGNKRWSYEDMKTYFKTAEEKLDISNCKSHSNLLYEVIKQAWTEIGFDFETNNNNLEVNIGTRLTKLLTNGGIRLNTAKEYLRDAPNLIVLKNSYVQRVLIDRNSKIATGVEILYSDGTFKNIKVNNEVILSAGSVETPKILMLSGIGIKQHLEKHGVDFITDLPVGKNLQDHLIMPLFLKTNIDTTIQPQIFHSYLLQYVLSKTGPFTNIGITDFMGFINTNNMTSRPDIQFHHTYFTKNDKFMLKPYLKGVGYEDNIIAAIEELNKKSDLLGIYPTLLRPMSRGNIIIRNSNAKFKPVIMPNYLKHPADLDTFCKAVAFVKKLTKTTTYKHLGIELALLDIPKCRNMTEEDYWICYIKHMATTVYHPVGTVRMGPESEQGVVNEDLIVHGVSKLRVVDASIMPFIPSGNTMAATMAIAEKAVDIITTQYNIKTEL